MFSGEERVGLGKNLKARGNVEEWLTAVERENRGVFARKNEAGLHDYDQRPRDDWIVNGDHPGQVVATVAQMTWARDAEHALRGEVNGTKADMDNWSAAYKEDLQKLIILI